MKKIIRKAQAKRETIENVKENELAKDVISKLYNSKQALITVFSKDSKINLT